MSMIWLYHLKTYRVSQKSCSLLLMVGFFKDTMYNFLVKSLNGVATQTVQTWIICLKPEILFYICASVWTVSPQRIFSTSVPVCRHFCPNQLLYICAIVRTALSKEASLYMCECADSLVQRSFSTSVQPCGEFCPKKFLCICASVWTVL